jgi:hypothetical protein
VVVSLEGAGVSECKGTRTRVIWAVNTKNILLTRDLSKLYTHSATLSSLHCTSYLPNMPAFLLTVLQARDIARILFPDGCNRKSGEYKDLLGDSSGKRA